MSDLIMKKNDLEPVVNAVLRDGDGLADLTGATVKFIMKLGLVGAVKVNSSATIVSATGGQVRYTWAGTDTDTAGDYICEWEVTRAGKKSTFPNGSFKRVRIVTDLA